MKKFVRILGVTVLLAVSLTVVSGFSVQSFAASEKEFLSVDEIKPGMKGYGLTVFQGTKPEKFDVEIIGVWEIVEGWNLIIARISGGPLKDVHGNLLPLEKVGVIAAMSGSPVYIDGKLIGAIAYSIGSLTHEAYAGITPIKLMTKEAGSIFSGEPHLATGKISPIKTPLLVSGFGEKALKGLCSFFGEQGFEVKIISTGKHQSAQKKNSCSLEPGSSIMVVFMRGDFWAGASGTVTYIDTDGDKVYAFGHASEELRNVDFPFYKSGVLTVIAGADSFKISSGPINESLGSIRKDFFAGIVGVLGEEAKMIPVKVNLKKGNKTADFEVEIVNHRVLTEELLIATIGNALYLFQPDLSFSTVKFQAKLKIKDIGTLEINDVFLTNQDGLGGEFNKKIIQGILDPLFDSHFEFEIESVEFDIEILAEENILVLDEAYLSKHMELIGEGSVTMKKNESINLTLVLKDIKTGEHYRATLPVPIIDGVEEGVVRIRIDSGRSIKLLKILDRPQSPKEQIEQLAEYYFSNNVVYLQIIYPLEQDEPEEIKISSGQICSKGQEVVSGWEKMTEEKGLPAKTKEEELKLVKVSTPFKGVIIAGEVLTFRIEKSKEEPEEQPEEESEVTEESIRLFRDI